MSPGRAELARLETDGGYVFHGSGEELFVLEPQQAHNVREGKRIADGPPAVFATPAADYAVFMAIFSKRNCPLGRHTRIAAWGMSDGAYKLWFEASPNTLSQVDGRSIGWVYAFRKSDFHEKEPGSLEFICRHPVAPVHKFRVERGDILGQIRIMDRA